MSSGCRNRKSTSPLPEALPPTPAKRSNRRDVFAKPSKYCSECNRSYTNDRAHKTTCTCKEVSCVYPLPNSEGHGQAVVLHGVGGFFECIRCGKQLQKDQNMKNHTRQCYGNGKDIEVENEKSNQPFLPSALNPHGDEISGIVESADARRLMAAETSSQSGSEPADNVQPCSSDGTNPLSPIVTSPGPSEAARGSYLLRSQVSTDSGRNYRHRSTSLSVTVPSTEFLTRGKPGVPAIPQHPTSPKAVPSPANEHSVVDDSLLKCLAIEKASKPRAEESGGIIRTACDNVTKSCIACWSSGLEYHSHSLDGCRWGRIDFRGERWREWIKSLRLPVGCCFFCGCPKKMIYISDSGQELRVHEHASDQSCHWITVFKPLAFIVFHSPIVLESLSKSSRGKGIKLDDIDNDIDMAEAEYVRWLCGHGDGGILNLLNVLLHICEVWGVPKAPL